MARNIFDVELGYGISAVNGALLVSQLAGSAAPGGDTGPQDAAPIGSSYQRTNGLFYVKTANAGAAADWDPIPLVLSAGYAAANGTVAIGDSFEEAIEKLAGNQIDLTTLSGVAQGAVDLGVFTGVTIADNSTVKGALQAIETAYEETDVNVNDAITASGIAENATDYGTFTGTLLSDNQTSKQLFQILETAVEEIDQNVNDLITLSGVAENATDLGTFTGSVIPDTSTVKGALQSLETFVESISGGVAITASGVTTLQDIDSVLVDDVHSIEWEIVMWEEATPANKQFLKITALHNGSAAADATLIDDSSHTKLRLGSNFNAVFVVDISGAAAAQVMRLRASSSTAGMAMEVRRTSVV
jgi:hypothetical protein